jgi:plastocyanin
MKALLFSLVSLLLLAAPAVAGEPLAVEAVNEGIYYHHWTNAVQTVIGGQEVKFANPGGAVPHGLKFTGGSAGVTPTCTGIPQAAGEPGGALSWEGHCKFTKPGTYTFICTVHPTEMYGTITVSNGEPTVFSEQASGLGESEATLNGSVNPNGKATKYFFEWGENELYGQQTTPPPAIEGTSPQAVSAHLAGLTPGTVYHYRLIAENEAGTVEGADVAFTTVSPPGKPTTLTAAAIAVGETSATLKGSVNPDGQLSEYRFEWGLTTSYGALTELLPEPAEDRLAHSVSAKLEDLLPGTVYHYRLVAKNVSGSSQGLDREFKTASPPPPQPSPEPTPGPQPSPGPTSTEPNVPLLTSVGKQEGTALGAPVIPGSLKLAPSGAGVRGSIAVGLPGAGARLEVELLARPAALGLRGSKAVVVGRLKRTSVRAGTLSFTVALSRQARLSLRRRGRLALTAKLVLTPTVGKATPLSRALTLRA